MGPKTKGSSGRSSLTSEELKCPGALLCSRYKLRFSADKDAVGTVVSRLEANSMGTASGSITSQNEDQEGGTAEARVKRTKLGDKPSWQSATSWNRSRTRPLHPRPVVMSIGGTCPTWPEQSSRTFKTNPEQPKPMRRRRMTMYSFLWILHEVPRQNK